MLQIIRSTAGSWVVKILFVVLIISFAVWGIGDITRGVQGDIAKVGDEKITPQELDREFKAEINRMRQVLGPDFNETQARQFGLVDSALERLIQRRLLALAADDAGLRIADETVAETARRFPVFQDGFGRFDVNVMREVLRRNGLTEAEFIEQIRADMAQTDMIGAVTAGAFVPRTLAESLYRFREERRRFDLVTIPNTAMPDAPAPDEAALAQYQQDNAVRYTAPEYRTVHVALLESAALAKTIEVTEQQIQEYYEAHSSDYVTAERRSLSQIVFPDRAAADAALAAVQNGKTLSDIARAAKLETVALEDVLRADLPAELAEPVFTAPQGAVSAPVESAFGVHVFTVTGISQGGTRDLAAVKDEVAAKVRQEKALDELYAASTRLEDALASGTPLAEAAQQAGGRVVTLTNIDNEGRDQDGNLPAEGLPAAAAILTNAFSLPAGQTGSVTEAGSDAFYAVQVEKVTPSALRPLADVRGRVLADWQAERKAAAAAELANQVAEKMRAGASAKEAATGVTGAWVQTTDPIRRADNRNAAIPAELLRTMFAARPESVATGASATGHVVARLTEIIPADPQTAQAAAMITDLATSQTEATASDLAMEYLAGLRAKYGVTINRSQIDTLYRPQE